MKSKTFILPLALMGFLPLHATTDGDTYPQEVWGNSDPVEFSLTPDMPVSGEVVNNMLVLNFNKSESVVVTIINKQGITVLEKEVSQKKSACIAIPLNGLQKGETYVVALRLLETVHYTQFTINL